MGVPKWTGQIVGKMHIYEISREELSEKVGYVPGYVSSLLNGKRTPKGAKEKLNKAIKEIIEEREK